MQSSQLPALSLQDLAQMQLTMSNVPVRGLLPSRCVAVMEMTTPNTEQEQNLCAAENPTDGGGWRGCTEGVTRGTAY
jgi:hypothetical protein